MDFYHLNFGGSRYFAPINFGESLKNLRNPIIISIFAPKIEDTNE